MRIRRASKKDIEGVNRLLSQVLEIHANIRPDIFISGTKKYTDIELAGVFANDETTLSVSGREYKTSDRLIEEDDIITIDLSPQNGDTWGDYARTIIVQDGKVVEPDAVINDEWKKGLAMETFFT